MIPTRTNGVPVVTVRDLRMRYGDNDVLTGVDFDIHAGEVVCLLGPNGAGKTTTIEILEGFRIRSAGEVSVLGEDPATRERGLAGPHRRGAAVLARPPALDRRAGCSPSSAATTRRTRRPSRPRPWDVEELLDIVGLTELADRKISTLSGGQRRRLDVAMGIVGRPELLFLDEPTAGFDPQARRDFHHLVHRLVRPREHHDPAHHPRPRRGREAGRPGADPGRWPHRRRRQRRGAGAAGSPARPRCGGPATASASCTRPPTRPAFVRELFAQYGDDVHDLEVRRASLEDAYLTLVQQHESGQAAEAAARPSRR